MELERYVLLYLVGSLCLISFTKDDSGFAQAEKFFLNKDQIISTENRSKRSAGIIRSTSQANAYMMRYGYLKCKPHGRKKESRMRNRYRQFNRPGSHHQHQQQQQSHGSSLVLTLNCDKQRVSQAIMQYQRTYHLPVTGQLDKDTKELMSESRCGNRDQNDGVVDDEVLQAQRVLLQQRIQPHQQSFHRSNRRFGRSVQMRESLARERSEEVEEEDERENKKEIDSARDLSGSDSTTSMQNPLHRDQKHSSGVPEATEKTSELGEDAQFEMEPLSSSRVSADDTQSTETTSSTFLDSLSLQLSSRLKEAFSEITRQRYRGQNGPDFVPNNEDFKTEPSAGTVRTAKGSISPGSSVQYGGTNEQLDNKHGRNKRPSMAGLLLDKTNLYKNRRQWRSTSNPTTGLSGKNSPRTKSAILANKATLSPLSNPPPPATTGNPPNGVETRLAEVDNKAGGVYNYFNSNVARPMTGPQTTSPSPWWPPSPHQNYPILARSSPPFEHQSSTHSRSPTPASSSFIQSTHVSHADSGTSIDPIRSLDSNGSQRSGIYDHSETKGKRKNGFSNTSSSSSSSSSSRSSSSNSISVNWTSLKTTTQEATRSSSRLEPIDHLTNKRILNESLHNHENETALIGERKDKQLGPTTTTTTTVANGHRVNNRKTNDRKWTQIRGKDKSQIVPIEGRSKRNWERLCRRGRANSRGIICNPCKQRENVGSSSPKRSRTFSKTSRKADRQRCRRVHRRRRHRRHHKKETLISTTSSILSSSTPDSSSFISSPPLQLPSSSSKPRLKRSPPHQFPMTNRISAGSQPELKSKQHDPEVVTVWDLAHPKNTKSFTRESPAYHPTPTSPPLSTPYPKSQTALATQLTPSSSQPEASFFPAPSSPPRPPSPAPLSHRTSQSLTVNETPSLTPRASITDNMHLVNIRESSVNVTTAYSKETKSWPKLSTEGDAYERVAMGAQMESIINDNAARSAQLGISKNNSRNSRFKKENNNNNNKLKDDSVLARRRKELLRRPSPGSTSFLSSYVDQSASPHRRWWNKTPKESLLISLLRYGMSPEERHHLQVRTNFLHRTIEQLKKTDPLWLRGVPKQERTKRSLVVNNMTAWGQMFKKKVVRWRLLASGYSNRIPLEEQRATLTLAFRMWNEVIPINFVEDLTSDVRDVDIHIAFGRGAHQNCEIEFDGTGGDVAHSWYTGNMHFDDDENFKAIYSPVTSGIYLLRVAVHEIGHVLGLNHTEKVYSIMYAIYHSRRLRREEFELGWEDRKDVQKIYGVCGGTFNTVFDWVRRRPNEQFIFNTYFFRGNRYWMYENHANRTRYGDPLNIGREWEGIPNDINGYVHIWFFDTSAGIVDVTYFFKGVNYYMYDSVEDRVVDGWPHKISEGFGPKEGGKERIPDHLDSIFFDMRDSNIYFFKGDKVYVYNPRGPGAPSTSGCCERIVDIREEYPSVDNHPLPDNLDAVYYSYKEKSMYFLKGEDVWRNVRFHRRQRNTVNEIRYEGKWYEHWYDICDVKNTIITPNGEIEDIGT